MQIYAVTQVTEDLGCTSHRSMGTRNQLAHAERAGDWVCSPQTEGCKKPSLTEQGSWNPDILTLDSQTHWVPGLQCLSHPGIQVRRVQESNEG